MNNNKKILFIINPVSGIGKKKIVENQISKTLDKKKFTPEIVYTAYAGHAAELSKNAVQNFDIVVATGGDGTINEVSSGLIGSKSILGIVPAGSGNGFARFFKIPLTPRYAIEIINQLNIKTIDTINIPPFCSVNLAGIGFDAIIGHKFAVYGKRGFFPYFSLVMKEFSSYKPKYYKVVIDGKKYDREAFLITIANSAQYGFNAHISPKSLVDDGLLEVCFIKKFPLVVAPFLASRLFLKNMDNSKYSEIIKGKQVVVESTSDMEGHIDGEPVMFPKKITASINPLSLKVIVPKY